MYVEQYLVLFLAFVSGSKGMLRKSNAETKLGILEFS